MASDGDAMSDIPEITALRAARQRAEGKAATLRRQAEECRASSAQLAAQAARIEAELDGAHPLGPAAADRPARRPLYPGGAPFDPAPMRRAVNDEGKA